MRKLNRKNVQKGEIHRYIRKDLLKVFVTGVLIGTILYNEVPLGKAPSTIQKVEFEINQKRFIENQYRKNDAVSPYATLIIIQKLIFQTDFC